MKTRRSSLEAGLALDYAIGAGGARLAYLHDVTGASHGSVVQVGFGQRVEFAERFGVDAFVSVSQLDTKTTGYYFGVRDRETTASRPVYSPGSAISGYAGLRFNYDLDRRNTLLFGYEVTVLGNTLANSPIVASRVANLVYFGFGWRL